MRRFIIFIVAASLAILASCSSPKAAIERRNDIIRIAPTKIEKKEYYQLRSKNSLDERNALYLEGTVRKILKKGKWAECPKTDETPIVYYDTVIVFLDKNAPDDAKPEEIALKDIIPIGQILKGIDVNEYGNIDIFEVANNPYLPDRIRRVPIDSVIAPCPMPPGEEPCPCNDFSLDFSLKCPECHPSWWFLEPNVFYSFFVDYDHAYTDFRFKTEKTGEVAGGLRFGNTQVGLLYNFGIDVSNYFDQRIINRPLLAIYGKHKFDKIFCIHPYIYGLIGSALDKHTLEYIKYRNYDPIANLDCPCNFGFPLSLGIGIGLDIPIPSCLFNFTLDLGYRSLALGQSQIQADLTEKLFIRRLDTWNFRIGISLGNR